MKLTVRHLVRGKGQHRKLPVGAVAPQRFVDCPECGVETAATVHGSALLCAEGHQIPGGTQ
jgi:hypothetical protein